MLKFLGSVSGAAIALAGSSAAFAQVTAIAQASTTAEVGTDQPQADEASTGGITDIIVTAQKRSERLQDVPIAVSAVTGSQLEDRGVTGVTELRTAVPTLNLTDTTGSLSTSLRGVGSNGFGAGIENPIALYIDNVYYASALASIFSLDSVEQIEVLKGPQGTLFGRNATGGLIQITTRDPESDPSAEVKLSYGNYGTITAGAYVGGPITDTVRANLAVRYSHQADGWGTNLATGEDVYQVDHDFTTRAKLVFEPSSATKFTLIGDYSNVLDSLHAHTVLPGTTSGLQDLGGNSILPIAPDYGYDVNTNDQPRHRQLAGGVSLRWDQEIGSLNFMSITAYRKGDTFEFFDYDATPLPISRVDSSVKEDQFSQELQLSSPSTGAFKWLIGAYYFDASAAFNPARITPGNGVIVEINSEQLTRSYAGFAQGSYELAPGTTLTLGGRYTSEKRRAVNGSVDVFVIPIATQLPTTVFPDASATFKRFTYRVSLDHKFTSDVLGYISVNSGFKSGGFNTAVPGTAPFRPEKLTAYEAGIKSDLFDRKVRLNLAGYYYDYKDLQVNRLLSGSLAIINGGSARVYGFDLDATIQVTDELQLNGGIGVVDAKFKSFPGCPIGTAQGGTPLTLGSCAGNKLPLSSPFVGSVDATYKQPVPNGSLKFNANLYYNGGFHLESDNIVKQRRFAQVGGSIKYEMDSGLSLGVFGKNLTNKRTISYSQTTPDGTHDTIFGAPRTYGVTLGYTF